MINASLLALSAVMAASFTWSTTTTKPIAAGVTLTQNIQINPPLLVNVLTIDPHQPGVLVAPAVANDSLTNNTGDIRKGRENVASLVVRKDILAAVNGDYFPFTGDPLGLGVLDSEIYSEPYSTPKIAGRAAIGWLGTGQAVIGIPHMDASVKAADGTIVPITGINRLTATDNSSDCVICTPRFGPNSGGRGSGTEIVVGNTTLPLTVGTPLRGVVTSIVTHSATPAAMPAGSVVISVPSGSPLAPTLIAHFHVGDPVSVTCNLTDVTPSSIGSMTNSWNGVREAIGGGPILLRNRKIIVDAKPEGFPTAFSTTQHARTAVGIKPNGTILIVTVDAGSAFSGGISLPGMATLLQSLGAVNAINLDGGGSTTMVVRGMTVDYPSGSTYERPVADMLTVQAPLPTVAATSPILATPLDNLQVGENVALTLTQGDDDLSGAQQQILWNGPVGNMGYITQDGIFHILRQGKGTISALLPGASMTASVSVPSIPSAPAVLPTPVAASPPVSTPPVSPAPQNTTQAGN